MQNDWNAKDTATEAALRTAIAKMRRELHAVIGAAQQALEDLDNVQRPGFGLTSPGKIIDATDLNGYAAQMNALLALPDWNDEVVRDIFLTAGKA